jgi:D-alanine-D-alanine ligase-like ATP-grasp enzyme
LSPPLTVLIDRWRMHPLVWLHRAEARAITAELRAAGRSVEVRAFVREALPQGGRILLRLSDPVMVDAVQALAAAGIACRGPGKTAFALCYDKWRATQMVRAAGIDCPETCLGVDGDTLTRPVVVKPRRGSDSLGLRVLRAGPLPARLRNARMLAQAQVFGAELTVSVIDGVAGEPLRLELPEGVPYTFLRKYLRRPIRAPLADRGLAARVQQAALIAAAKLGVDWVARVDFIHERASGRLRFLECDAAPLVGPASAFAASLAAAGMARGEQLARLLGES